MFSKQLHEAAIFVSQHTDAEITQIKQTLQDFLKSTLEDLLNLNGVEGQQMACWLTIRITSFAESATPRYAMSLSILFLCSDTFGIFNGFLNVP
jgi:hypothetical protein